MPQMPPTHGADSTHGRIEIRVKGQLDARWSTWFDGLTVSVEDGTTLIHGQVVDQAALFGILQKLRDLALPLVSVELDPSGTTTSPPAC